MTPQIKFRGYRTETNEPVYGNLLYSGTDYLIREIEHDKGFHKSYFVEHESLGMFTGRTDKNGKEIYGAIGDKGGDVDQSGRVVVYDRGSFILADKVSGEYALIGDCEFCEIIGNQWEQNNGKV